MLWDVGTVESIGFLSSGFDTSWLSRHGKTRAARHVLETISDQCESAQRLQETAWVLLWWMGVVASVHVMWRWQATVHVLSPVVCAFCSMP